MSLTETKLSINWFANVLRFEVRIHSSWVSTKAMMANKLLVSENGRIMFDAAVYYECIDENYAL